MSEQLLNMITIAYFIVTVIVVIVSIILVKRNIKKQHEDTLNVLERNKNLIISGSILSELNKVESLINNKELEKKYEIWKNKFKNIKDKEVPKIKDKIIDVEELKRKKKYK